MALIHCDFYSDVLGMSSSMCVILPQATKTQIGLKGVAGRKSGKGHPTLWLLHGLSDDHTIWCRRTSIERYVSEMGLAVVMPNCHRSWYVDMARGGKYGTFLADELPTIARSLFPLSERRGDNFIAGLSMGGYGAFRLALDHPDRYAAAASLSGALDVAKRAKSESSWRAELTDTFGPLGKLTGSGHDLFHLAAKLAKSKRRGAGRSGGPGAHPGAGIPKFYQCCGTEDVLYAENVVFRDHARRLGLPLTYVEGPGVHEWDYWDLMIPKVLAWLPLDKRG